MSTVPRLCDIEGCGRPHNSHGLCTTHIRRQRRGADENIRVSYAKRNAVCVHPGCEKPAISSDRCGQHYQSEIREPLRHGMSRDERNAMLARQDGRCLSCHEPIGVMKDGRIAGHIDHDHSCCARANGCKKCVRGILCHGCNTALGMLDESVEKMKNLIDYIEAWRARP